MHSFSSSPRSIDDSPRFARVIIIVAGLVILLAGLIWSWRGPIAGSGGIPIPGEIVIGVPQFYQADPRWSSDRLADTPGDLGGEGCAVSSAAMVLSHYGMDVDPRRLNRFLTQNKGYEGRGWLRWESAAEFSPGMVEKAYEDLPSHALIDWNLLRGNPVIVRIRRVDGITHFVVIVGKRGFDYLIRDPAGYQVNEVNGASRESVYEFKRLGVPIEALRYYRGMAGKS